MPQATILEIRRGAVDQHGTGGGGPGDGMESRLAKVEAAVEHIQTTLTDIKTDVREMRTQIADVKDRISEAKTWALILYIGLAGGLLFALAKGFKWM